MIKTYIQRFLQIAALLIGAWLIYMGFDFFLSDDIYAQSRVTIHDFYEQDEVDYLFLGPSHSTHMVDAAYLSELTGKNCYNLATTAQYFLNSYYLLEDALEHKKVNNVWMELSFSRFKRGDPIDTATYLITDYLPSILTRMKMIMSVYEPDKYINSFFRVRRNLDPLNLPDLDTLQSTVKGKRKTRYKKYLGTGSYLGKGQWKSNATWGYDDTIAFYRYTATSDSFEVGNISDMAMDYYNRIIKLCKEKNVPLTFYIAPYTETYTRLFEDYEAVEEVALKCAEENDIPFIDLNLVKDEYLSLSNDDFYNLDHIKSDAGKEVMEFINQYIENPSGDYFCSSLEEKYPDRDKILAVSYNRKYYVDGVEEGFKTKESAEEQGKITHMVVDVSAFGYKKIKSDVRVVKVTKDDRYQDGPVIEGEKMNGVTTRYELPADTDDFYRVEILNPKNGKIMYQAFTNFKMR